MKKQKSINRRLKDWVDREMAEMFKSNQPPEKDPRQMTYFATPSSLYSRPVSEWTKDEMAAEIMLLQEMQRGNPPEPEPRVRTYPTIPIGQSESWMRQSEASPECNVWGVPFPEQNFTPYLAGAGGPKPSGMKPQASPSASPASTTVEPLGGIQTPSAITGSVEGSSKSGSPDRGGRGGSDTSGSQRTDGPTLTPMPASPSSSSGITSSDTGETGGSPGRVSRVDERYYLPLMTGEMTADKRVGATGGAVCAGPGKWLCGVGFGHVCGGQS